MSTLTDRLTTILGSVPEAVEEYISSSAPAYKAKTRGVLALRDDADYALNALVDALEERSRMLRLAVQTIVAVAWGGDDRAEGEAFWMADLRARAAEEGSRDE
jgi:hypothetical protein